MKEWKFDEESETLNLWKLQCQLWWSRKEIGSYETWQYVEALSENAPVVFRRWLVFVMEDEKQQLWGNTENFLWKIWKKEDRDWVREEFKRLNITKYEVPSEEKMAEYVASLKSVIF